MRFSPPLNRLATLTIPYEKNYLLFPNHLDRCGLLRFLRQKERNVIIDQFDYDQLDDWQKNDDGREKDRHNLELNDDGEEEEFGGQHLLVFNQQHKEEEFADSNAFRKEELG